MTDENSYKVTQDLYDGISTDNGSVPEIANVSLISVDEVHALAAKSIDKPHRSVGISTYTQWAYNSVKRHHANALEVLTKSETPQERDTWGVKTLHYRELRDGKLAPKHRANIALALLPDETVEIYLERVSNMFDAYSELMYFAEGFKRQTNLALSGASDFEQVDAVLDSASKAMELSIASYKEKMDANQ